MTGATPCDNIRRARTLRGVAPDDYLPPQRSIGALMDERAAAVPEQEFLVYYNDDNGERARYTYRQFAARVNQVACLLSSRYGVQRGDRVATLAFNHPDSAFVLFACWKLGAAVAPQSAAEDDARIAYVLRNANCKIALVRPEYVERARTLQAKAACLEQIVAMDEPYQRALDAAPEEFAPVAAHMLEDEALLLYTSGTTGAPKGVQLSQYNLLCNADSLRNWHGVGSGTRMLCVLPIHHINGIVVTLLTPLLAGGSVVLLRGFKVSTFWAHLAAERAHIVSLVPTLLQFLCEANEDTSRHDLSALRHVICGAGTLAVALAARFEASFGVPIVHGYGLSETSGYSTNMPLDLGSSERQHWMRDYGYPSIGVEFGTNELTIHDAAGQELGPGQKGEIVIRGHNVMLGYFQRPDANAETFRHGWFRSGDEGFYELDVRGRKFFFITGRIKELINRGGEKYSPFEIEEVLLEIPGVKVALAIAFDNDWYGEEVGAYIVREAGANVSEQQVLAHCRSRMPFAKTPKVVHFGSEIPVTATGKYQRLRLKELFEQFRATQFRQPREAE